MTCISEINLISLYSHSLLGKPGFFKEFCESSIRGLHNEILRNKAGDFLSIQALNGFKVETFDQLR